MKKIAILGAGGFLGSRFVEMAVIGRRFEVVPVIRGPKSAARLSRFGPIWKLADTSSATHLAKAIEGCDALVNVTVGEFGGMRQASEIAWQACATAGVPRLVHVGTAEVFGRVEDSAISDDSLPLRNHWMPYARAKGDAEEAVRSHFDDSRVDAVVLRPGLIWGPKSPWVEGPAQSMTQGSSFLIGGGQGICNLIYIDNLATQVLSVTEHPGRATGCYNVSDDEIHTWSSYYTALAGELGVPFEEIHQLPGGDFRGGFGALFQEFKGSAFGGFIKRNLTPAGKRRIRLALLALKNRRDPGMVAPQPSVSKGDWHLQNVRRKLPNTKFRSTFGRRGELAFSEAMARTGEWLRFSGFGVTN